MTTPTTVNVRLQLRADTAANWTAANPTLLANEVGLETDTKKLKVGNGSSAWNSLAYFPSIVSGGTVLGNLEIGSTGTLTFEGSTADGFETTLAVTNPTADRTITLPNQSGTVVVSGNASIVNADIAANAEIAVSKLANGTANQVIVTDGTNVSWSDDLTLAGNLTVNGTTTTINTQDLLVEDKNIIIGNVTSPTDVTADGGGITLKGATDKTINWVDATDAWTSSERFSVPLGSAASPSLTFTGDENTGIYSPGADQVAISTGGSGRLFVNSDGTVSVGNALTFSGATSLGLRASTNTAVGNLLVLQKSNDGTNPANIAFCKSRGTASSPTAVLSEDVSAAFFGLAFDGTTYQSIGGIKYVVQGIAGTNDVSGYITLDTRPSGVGAFTQERLRVTSDGKLGLGTSSPASILHVNQDVSSGNYQSRITLENTDQRTIIGSYWQSGVGAYSLIQATNQAESTGEALLLNPSGGNVGIGTTAPTSLLEASGANCIIKSNGSTGYGAFYANGASGNSSYYFLATAGTETARLRADAPGELVFGTGSSGTERARIDSSGRLLVGTSSTRSVAGNFGSTTNQILFETVDIASFTAVGNKADSSGPQFVLGKSRSGAIGGVTAVQNGDVLGVIKFAGANGTDLSNVGAEIYTAVDGTPFSSGDTTDLPGRLVFGTTADGDSGPTERMRITNDGKLLFACIGDPSSTIKGGAYIGSAASPYFSSSAGTSTSTYTHFYFINGNGTVGSISTNGSATAYNTSSDYRLKENVTTVTDGITRLQQLKPSRFNFIADPAKTVDGFLAHEVQSVVPEAITGEKDAVDDDGNPIYQGIDQSKLVPLLTAALQEALAEIESLKARVTALEP